MKFKRRYKTVKNYFSKSFKTSIRFNIPHFYYKRLENFSSPGFESGIKDVVMSVLKGLKHLKLKYDNITLNSVKESDSTEIDVYCRFKRFGHNLDKTIFDLTVDWFCELLNTTNIKYTIIDDIEVCLDILPKNTSSCFPNYVKKGDKSEVLFVKKMITGFKSSYYTDSMLKFLYQFPTTIFHRFTPKITKGPKNLKVKYKIRQIFGVSTFICALEVMFFKNFKDHVLNVFREYQTIGLTRFEQSQMISRVRNTARQSHRYIICGDIKGCDKSIPAAFHVLFYTFALCGVENEFDIKCILSIAKYMTYTPIISTKGKVDVSNGSTTTGSWLTSVFTTFSVFFALSYCFYKLNNRFPKPGEILLQGDDFLFLVETPDDFKTLKYYLYQFNLRLKTESELLVTANEEISFLGYFWDLENTPGQSEQWIASRVLFPEKFSKISGPDRTISRYLSIIVLLRNFKELFKRFVDEDSFLKERWRSTNFDFHYFSKTGVEVTNKVPISKFLKYGWTIT